MKVIKIKSDEAQFLRTLKNDTISDYLSKAHFDNKSSALVLVLEAEDLDKLTDTFAQILTDKGITNNEINNFGKQIDTFIGKFNPYE